jgi:hypothetical protein
LLWKKKFSDGGRFLSISDNEKLLCYANFKDVYLFDLATGNNEWNWNITDTKIYKNLPSNADFKIVALKTSANLNRIAAATRVTQRIRRPEGNQIKTIAASTIILSGEGKYLNETPIQSSDLDNDISKLEISADGHSIYYPMDNKIKKYRVD